MPFSEGEFFTLIGHGVLALFFWFRWLYITLSPRSMGRPVHGRWLLLWAPMMSMAGLIALLQSFASSDVPGTIYMFYYAVMGAAWVGGAMGLFGMLGVHPRDDAVERRNPAAIPLLVGAIFGCTLAFAGANFGDGPGWWVVMACACMSLGGLLLLWMVIQAVTHAAEMIGVERDVPTGVRCGFLLVACGMVLGRSVAGDWVDFAGALVDFLRRGSPVLLLAGLELIIAALARPKRRPEYQTMPLFARGTLPGMFYLSAAALYITFLGWW